MNPYLVQDTETEGGEERSRVKKSMMVEMSVMGGCWLGSSSVRTGRRYIFIVNIILFCIRAGNVIILAAAMSTHDPDAPGGEAVEPRILGLAMVGGSLDIILSGSGWMTHLS